MKKLVFLFGLFAFILLSTQCKKDEEDKDTTPPVITLKGDTLMFVNKDSLYVEPGYTATDDTDGDITNKVSIKGHVDTSVEGTYFLYYDVSDAAGNAAEQKKREVKVMIF